MSLTTTPTPTPTPAGRSASAGGSIAAKFARLASFFEASPSLCAAESPALDAALCIDTEHPAAPLPALFDSKEAPRLVEHSYEQDDSGHWVFVVRVHAMGRAVGYIKRMTSEEAMSVQLEELHAEAMASIADSLAQYVRDEADAQWRLMLKREQAEREMWGGRYTK